MSRSSSSPDDKKAPCARIAVYLTVYAAIAVASLLAGLQHFVLTLPQQPRGALQFTDGIVVMTGGQQRLNDGLQLLTDGKAEKMLISGVGEGVNRAVLVQELALDDSQAELLFCCVELDFTAGNTRGNATAARSWASTQGMGSLRLVTASYHMPRVLVVFAREMPDSRPLPMAGDADDLNLSGWWRDPAMLRLLTREYAKYLTETIRI